MLIKTLISAIITSLALTPCALGQTLSQSETTTFTLEEKIRIYEQEKQTLAQPALLNIVPFGVGSFSQGDLGTGATLLALDAAAAGLVVYGYSLQSGWDGLVPLSGAYALYILGRIAGFYGVSNHVNQHNQALLNRLDLDASQIPVSPYPGNWTESLFSYSTRF